MIFLSSNGSPYPCKITQPIRILIDESIHTEYINVIKKIIIINNDSCDIIDQYKDIEFDELSLVASGSGLSTLSPGKNF